MSTREENWKDVAGACRLALDGKKVAVGFVGAVLTVLVLGVASSLEPWLAGAPFRPQYLFELCATGQWDAAQLHVQGMLNPFLGGLSHFLLSLAFYVMLIDIWAQCGGIISRLVVLQYAKDALPSLAEARGMVAAKRKDYFMAPMISLVIIALCAVPNLLSGLIGSIPAVGQVLEGVLLLPGILTSAAITFCIVLGLLSFGLALASISIEGKSAFESWTVGYSYVLWGLPRFIFYAALGGIIGHIAVAVIGEVAQLFVFVLDKTFSFGHVVDVAGSTTNVFRTWVLQLIGFATHMAVFGFAASYFFTLNTIMCFLLRKHVDRIEVDDIYEEETEQEPTEEVATEPEEEEAPAEEPAPAETGEEEAQEEPAEPAPESEEGSEQEEEQAEGQ